MEQASSNAKISTSEDHQPICKQVHEWTLFKWHRGHGYQFSDMGVEVSHVHKIMPHKNKNPHKFSCHIKHKKLTHDYIMCTIGSCIRIYSYIPCVVENFILKTL